MKILTIVDKKGSAISRLAEEESAINTHHDIRVISFHPKRPNEEEIQALQEGLEWADVINFQYWRSALTILDEYGVDKPKILQHHNPYSVNEDDWHKKFDIVVTNNRTIQSTLPYSRLVYNTVDVAKFQFVRKLQSFKKVGMVTARIEGKKGVLETAQACKEIGIRLQLVGRVSDRDYFNKVIATGVVDFMEDISEEELVRSYHSIDALVVNSIDDFESGPLPVLEAMSSGTVVISRLVGMVPDIYNNKNMVISSGSPKDIKDAIAGFYKLSTDEQNDIISSAWETAKRLDNRYRARQYSKLYFEAFSSQELVSIVIPTANRPKELVDLVASIQSQDYTNIEVVISDDGLPVMDPIFIKTLKEHSKFPIKYVTTNKQERSYNLAYARNLAVAEAEGEYVMFCDDRFILQPGTVSTFMLRAPLEQEWHFGNKGGNNKTGFVENFSIVRRSELVKGGMFNTLINKYGGMTQEINTRFTRQGFKLMHRPDVNCDINRKPNSKDSRKPDILDMKFLLYKLYN